MSGGGEANSLAGAGQPDQAARSPGRSVLSIIRDLQSGAVAGAALGADDRRRCIEHLTVEGYSVAEIAEIFKISERTITRDKQLIRTANALKAGPGFAGEMAGNLIRQAEAAVARLRRIGRDRETPADVKVEAERAAWLTAREAVESMQRLGYLPTAPQRLQAEITSSTATNKSGYQELKDELSRLEMIVGGASVVDARRTDHSIIEPSAVPNPPEPRGGELP